MYTHIHIAHTYISKTHTYISKTQVCNYNSCSTPHATLMACIEYDEIVIYFSLQSEMFQIQDICHSF